MLKNPNLVQNYVGRLWSLAPGSYRPLLPAGTAAGTALGPGRNAGPPGTLEPGGEGASPHHLPALRLCLLGGQTVAAGGEGCAGTSASGTALGTGETLLGAGKPTWVAWVHQAQGHAGHRATKSLCSLANFSFSFHFFHFSSMTFNFFYFFSYPSAYSSLNHPWSCDQRVVVCYHTSTNAASGLRAAPSPPQDPGLCITNNQQHQPADAARGSTGELCLRVGRIEP